MDRQANGSSANLNIFWTKPERDIPRRPSNQSLSSSIQSKSSQNKLSSSQADLKTAPLKLSEDSQTSSSSKKLTFTDLCNEDKMRLVELFKEIAKLTSEKEQLEKVLDKERQKHESKMQQILNQQKNIIDEKELLLTKFAETEEKMARLNEREKSKKHANHEASHKKRPKSRNSSTPKNVSPRSVSPILNEIETKIDKNRQYTHEIDDQIAKMKKSEDKQSQLVLHSTFRSDTIESLSAKPKSTSHRSRIDRKPNSIEKSGDDDNKEKFLSQERDQLVNERSLLTKQLEQKEKDLQERQNLLMQQQQAHHDKLVKMIELTTQMSRAPVNYARYDEIVPTVNAKEPTSALNLNKEPSRASTSTIDEVSSRHSVATSPIRFVASKNSVERHTSPSPPLIFNHAQNVKARNETRLDPKKEDLNQLSFTSTSTNRTFRQQENDMLIELIDLQSPKAADFTKPTRVKLSEPKVAKKKTLFEQISNKQKSKSNDNNNDDDSQLIEDIFFVK